MNRTIETTEKLAQELRVKCKHIIAQKSKTSVYKEDMAGILNRYGEVYQEINDYYCNEPPEIKECDPFQVFRCKILNSVLSIRCYNVVPSLSRIYIKGTLAYLA